MPGSFQIRVDPEGTLEEKLCFHIFKVEASQTDDLLLSIRECIPMQEELGRGLVLIKARSGIGLQQVIELCPVFTVIGPQNRESWMTVKPDFTLRADLVDDVVERKRLVIKNIPLAVHCQRQFNRSDGLVIIVPGRVHFAEGITDPCNEVLLLANGIQQMKSFFWQIRGFFIQTEQHDDRTVVVNHLLPLEAHVQCCHKRLPHIAVPAKISGLDHCDAHPLRELHLSGRDSRLDLFR